MGSDDARERLAAPSDLITFGDIRAVLGVAKSRAWTITRDRDFPAPWFTSADGSQRLWLRSDVEVWLDQHRPGWREATQ